jgi:hypothetical protein
MQLQRLFALAKIELEEASTWNTLYRDDFEAIAVLNYCPYLENQAIANAIRTRVKNHVARHLTFPQINNAVNQFAEK